MSPPGPASTLTGVLVSMDGAQGADLLEPVDARTVVPVHHDDYGVFRSPRSDFEAEVHRPGLTDRLRLVERGEALTL